MTLFAKIRRFFSGGRFVLTSVETTDEDCPECDASAVVWVNFDIPRGTGGIQVCGKCGWPRSVDLLFGYPGDE
jgi:ribosomal protein S27AE